LILDDGALAQGRIAVRQAAGVLPDGTPFEIPGDDASPPALTIDPSLKEARVFLAIVRDRPGAPTTTFDESGLKQGFRYASRVEELADVNEGSSEQAPVQMAAPQLRLVAEPELTGALAGLALARVTERRADGQVQLDTTFIPPHLSSNDDTVLGGYVRELMGVLHQRSIALAESMLHPGRGGASEIASFLLLQVVNRYGALFDHFEATPGLHPERLYSECVQLAGELATFSGERRLERPFPAYDHDALAETFRPVMARLRSALAVELEQNAIRIELKDLKYGVRMAVFNDRSLLKSADFVLAVNAQVPAETIRLNFPRQSKLAPAEMLRRLVEGVLPGIPLRPLPVAPRQIPFHAGFTYFEIDTKHEYWQKLDGSSGLAIHVPDPFPGAELELWAIRG
jgi:type VI secretion system protein ImpJ